MLEDVTPHKKNDRGEGGNESVKYNLPCYVGIFGRGLIDYKFGIGSC